MACSSINSFSKLRRASLGLQAIAFWTPPNLVNNLLFLANKLPKTSKFHFFTLVVKLEMAKGRDLSPGQAFSTTFGNWGCSNHMVWKLKGLLVAFVLLPNNSIKTRQWSENVLERCVTIVSRYNILQLGLAKHRSSLSRIRLVTGLLLV